MKHTLFAYLLALCYEGSLYSQTAELAVDSGARAGAANAGQPLAGLTAAELAAFTVGKATFEEVDGVADGLGPGFNLDSCSGCHSHPAIGGTSPAINPQIAVATARGALNRVLDFLKSDGPIREVRMKRRPDGSADGGVHSVFVIAGRGDAPPGLGRTGASGTNTCQ